MLVSSLSMNCPMLKTLTKVLDILKNAQSLTDQERDMLLRLSKLLLNMRVQSWKDDISIPNLSDIGKDIRENLSRWSRQLPFGQSETDKKGRDCYRSSRVKSQKSSLSYPTENLAFPYQKETSSYLDSLFFLC